VSKQDIKIPGPQKGYTTLVDEAMLENAAKPSDKKYFPLRPSAAGYCTRRLAFDVNEYYGNAVYEKEARNPATLRLLNLGSSIEWHAIKAFEELAKFDPTLQIKYRQQAVDLFRLDPTDADPEGRLIDGSIDLTTVGPEYNGILDIKSKKDKFHASFKTEWDAALDKFAKMESLVTISDTAFFAADLKAFLHELNDPFFAFNFIQINSYLCSSWAKAHKFTHGSVIRYNKNDSRWLEIRFAPSDELFELVRTKFNIANQAAAKNAPESVPCDYLPGSIVCAYCPHKCHDGNELKAFFDTFAKKTWPKDISKIKSGKRLAELFEQYEEATKHAEKTEALEEEILKLLLAAGEGGKVRLANSNVYLIKQLKDSIVLRRSKA
jgi:hypothetical protein